MFHNPLMRQVAFGGSVLPYASWESWQRHHPAPTTWLTSSDLSGARVDSA
jgi:hypothetical protein